MRRVIMPFPHSIRLPAMICVFSMLVSTLATTSDFHVVDSIRDVSSIFPSIDFHVIVWLCDDYMPGSRDLEEFRGKLD